MVSIATALFIVVEGTILLFLVKFRRRRGDDTDGVHVEGNLPLEVFGLRFHRLLLSVSESTALMFINRWEGFQQDTIPHLM